VAIYTFPADAFVIQGDPEVIGESARSYRYPDVVLRLLPPKQNASVSRRGMGEGGAMVGVLPDE
jgi:hypothetical protein